MEWVFWILVVILCLFFYSRYQTKEKRKALIKKYGDENLVDKLMQGMFWQGQSEAQLLDALGKPLDIDQKVLKTKVKEVWKYQEIGKNRYALKIIIENGEVVGWDKK